MTLNVVHLCASDISGGAARSAYRLHQGLCLTGVDSEMLVLKKDSRDVTVRQFTANMTPASRISRRFWRLRQGRWSTSHRPLGVHSLEIFSTDRSPYGTSVLESIGSADIVNLHWVSGMFEYAGLAELTQRFPVVWTLHDMNPFTGGCHFDDNCGRFSDSCGECPQLESSRPNDVSQKVWRRKQMILEKIPENRLTIVAPSQCMIREVQRSPLLRRFKTESIPYGLDAETFRPRNPRVVRELLDIPESAKVVLFLADGIGNRRKGFDLLLNALRKLNDIRDLYLLAVGSGLRPEDINLKIPIRVMPTIHNDRLLSFVYSAADVFVMASRADNLPNTVMEAISCGVPIAGFSVGGVTDMVIPGRTGMLAEPGNVAELTQAIRQIICEDFFREQMKSICRQTAMEEYNLSRQARRYFDIYFRMTSGHKENINTKNTITECVFEQNIQSDRRKIMTKEQHYS